MSSINNEQVYLNLLQDILDNGVSSDDRTGVGTIRVFGRMLRFNLQESFPALTTKKLAWKGVVSELLWFLEGSGDERRLAEIRYGKPRSELDGKTTIWTANAEAPYWKPKARFEGDLGAPYGVQWRDWKSVDRATDEIISTDQITTLVKSLKEDPNSRRHLLTAWNPGELHQMALPPCHMTAQFSVINNTISCLMTQR